MRNLSNTDISIFLSLNCSTQSFDFSSMVLDHLCLHIENVKKKNNKMEPVLPEYNCLTLSPANLWQQDFHKFQQDPNLINTVYNYQVGKYAEFRSGIQLIYMGLELDFQVHQNYSFYKL